MAKIIIFNQNMKIWLAFTQVWIRLFVVLWQMA